MQSNTQQTDLNLIKRLGLQRSPLGVGKALGKQIWLHRSALEEVGVKHKTLILSVMDNIYCVVRLERDSDTFQLSSCSGFDSQREPTIHGHKTYQIVDGKLELIKDQTYQTNNLLIFHHKHLFVTPSYSGFDVNESIRWSLQWKEAIPNTRAVTSRIGRVKGWDEILTNNKLNTITTK